MEERETATSHDAIPIRDREAPYAGAAGQTRFENVHLVSSDGSAASISVCRVVNAQTHPELRTRALAGQLHRLEDGRELALSFVYHDPGARKFALVLPAVLAHTELKEWSRLMAEIAEDTRHSVPLYVRDNTTVIGLNALERYVAAPAEEPEPVGEVLDASSGASESEANDARREEREHYLLQRERELAEQERALIRMAEGLTAREGELHRMQEQLDAARAQHDRREEEWRQISLRAASWQHSANESGHADSSVARDGTYAGHSLPPPLPTTRHRTGPPPLPLRARAVPPPLGAAGHHDERRPITSVPPPLPQHLALAARDKDPVPEVAPPAYFAGQRAGQMAVKLTSDELWLFVQLDEVRAPAFRRGVDLLIQYTEVESYPVLVLSLLGAGENIQPVRLMLDGHSDSDLRVLEHLSRSFRARVAVYIGGVYCETFTVASLREGVAQAISDKLATLPSERPQLTAAEALVRVSHAPPPIANDDLPFGPARREASTTATVAASVEQLASWLRPEKLAEATLTYCIPRNVIDATIRRVLRAAVAFGIALPDDMISLALEHRAARDVQSLVRMQLAGFRQRVEHMENDLGVTATRRNWDQLLDQAARHEVEVDDATRALASATQSSRPLVRADAATRAPRPFEALTLPELRGKLKEEPERMAAIRELCLRGQASGLEPVLGVLDELPARDIPPAVAHLLLFGASTADGLIAALQSTNPALRQIAALGLGRLKLRRGLTPLIKQLEAEESEIHPELARALGDFGSTGVSAVTQAIPDSTRGERWVLALAHIANHGAAKEVEKLENNADAAVAQAARKAMAKRSRIEWEDLAVREQRSLGESEAAAQLSQAFYAELAKVAI